MTHELIFGNVEHPPFLDRLIPSSATGAWNDLGQRNPVGVCLHTMVGTLWGTDKWFRFDPATGRWPTGLTDYGIGGATDGPEWDGVIIRWNDPRGRRSGWASGGSDGLEGPGVAFVRTLGVNAINRDLVSIERSDGGKYATQPMSPKQFESMAALTAYWFDQAAIPYHDVPYHAVLKIVTGMMHFQFAIKGCPYDPIIAQYQTIMDRVKEIMRAAQRVEHAEPEPTPTPTEPLTWPNGWTDEALDKAFGKPIELRIDPRTGEIKSAKHRSFNAKGMLSNMWAQRAIAEGITDVKRIPSPTHITITESRDGVVSSLFVIPRSGWPDWIGFKGDGNSSWIWLQ